ncbi:MAG TPA: hypothetical protein VG387_02220 [Rhizomicrobium sp.]|jgi:hypothetical protein|nr:hypothetical protein [Rhizomicrobium sp.]
MRVAVRILCASLLAASLAPPALADNWVHTRDSASGLPMCFDKASVAKKADGLTYYAVKMCQDPSPQFYAVNCDANFKVELVVRIYDIGSADHYREMTVPYPQSGMALDADMACHKG